MEVERDSAEKLKVVSKGNELKETLFHVLPTKLRKLTGSYPLWGTKTISLQSTDALMVVPKEKLRNVLASKRKNGWSFEELIDVVRKCFLHNFLTFRIDLCRPKTEN